MPVIYHDLELIQLRMPRTGSKALRELLTRASDSWIGPEDMEDVEGHHWPIQHCDTAHYLRKERGYAVWATTRPYSSWKESVREFGDPNDLPTCGIFPEWPGIKKKICSEFRLSEIRFLRNPLFAVFDFLRHYLIDPADAVIPHHAVGALDPRRRKAEGTPFP